VRHAGALLRNARAELGSSASPLLAASAAYEAAQASAAREGGWQDAAALPFLAASAALLAVELDEPVEEPDDDAEPGEAALLVACAGGQRRLAGYLAPQKAPAWLCAALVMTLGCVLARSAGRPALAFLAAGVASVLVLGGRVHAMRAASAALHKDD
jgi:hypothetical protein